MHEFNDSTGEVSKITGLAIYVGDWIEEDINAADAPEKVEISVAYKMETKNFTVKEFVELLGFNKNG